MYVSSICICMVVCVYVCMSEYMSVCMYVLYVIYIRVYVCMYVLYVCMYVTCSPSLLVGRAGSSRSAECQAPQRFHPDAYI